MNNQPDHTRQALLDFAPEHNFFVGIDSDGCVFDTMGIKQKKCFHSLIVSHWHLEAIETYVRESAEFINLYSKWRGQNRFPCLVRSIDLLRDRPEVIQSGVELPEFAALREFMDSGVPLGNPSLERAVAESGNAELASVLQWSNAVNDDIARTVKNIPPFARVCESLEKLRGKADAIVVSQTPCEALLREWNEHDLSGYVRVIAGQELGTKTEHLKMAAADRYKPERILMLGDAPGDMKAAKANNALFYPINPGKEEESWERFHDEACDKFFAGQYAGECEEALISEFQALLPETPPWKL